MGNLERLLQVMERLRDPEKGCPWDLQQTFASIVPHTIEEAYEVAHAIEQGDLDELRGELGDLLFQVVFYAQLGKEQGAFDFETIAGGIADKMIRRHPHVFEPDQSGSGAPLDEAWEQRKAEERARKSGGGDHPGVLDNITYTLPAMSYAVKLQKRAARVGFDWKETQPALDKIGEELDEVRAELRSGAERSRVQDEIGDLLFACVNLARHLKIDPEQALRGTNERFKRRFRHIESAVRERGRAWEDYSLEELDSLWHEAKAREKSRDS